MTDRLRRLLRPALLLWLPAAAAATVLAGAGYGLAQHDLRSGANDPQWQIAEDAAAQLDAGAAPASVVPAGSIDITRSLATYVIVYDQSGHVLASNADLAGGPAFPSSALTNAHPGSPYTVTWDTGQGARGAVVVSAYGHGYVVAGRSLRLVEQRIGDELALAAAGWVGALGLSALAALVAVALFGAREGGAPGRSLAPAH